MNKTTLDSFGLGGCVSSLFAATLPGDIRKPRDVERVVEKWVEVPIQVTTNVK